MPRITLASRSPIMKAPQVSKSILYVDSWKGQDSITYWNGSADAVMSIPGNEIAIALQSSGAGLLNANDIFDVFATAAGPCIATNGVGAGWSGDSGGSLLSRGSGYSAIDEISHAYPTNANVIAHCYNGSTDFGPIAANQATLIGSIATDVSAPGKVSYIPGFAAAGGGAARLAVWNVFDEPVVTEVTDNGANWTFLGFTDGSGNIVDVENLHQSVNGGVGNQVVFLSGLARYSPMVSAAISMGSAVEYMPCYCGIGFSLDHGGSTSPDHLAEYLSPVSTIGVAADGVAWQLINTGTHAYPAMVGLHSIQAQETTDGLARCWFRTVGGQRSGITFLFQM